MPFDSTGRFHLNTQRAMAADQFMKTALGQKLTAALPQAVPGLKVPGNIDYTRMPEVRNPDGSVSTVRSMSFGRDNNEILVPTVDRENKRIMSEPEAIQRYDRTGEHMGIFSNPDSATNYGEQVHNDYASGKIKVRK